MIIDPAYHYETVNVEAQQQNPNSLLWWMRRIIALRSQHQVFGRGSIEFLLPENAKVLAFLRHHESESVLVVANLSRFAQTVSLDLHEYRGAVPVELFGGNEFPPIVEGSLQPHARARTASTGSRCSRSTTTRGAPRPRSRTCPDWWSTPTGASCSRPTGGGAPPWPGRGSRSSSATAGTPGAPRPCGPPRCSTWCRSRSVRASPPPSSPSCRSSTPTASPRPTSLPVTGAVGADGERVLADHGHAAIAWVDVAAWEEPVLLFDATVDDAVHGRADRRVQPGAAPSTRWAARSCARRRRRACGACCRGRRRAPGRAHVVEQSNTSVVFGNRVVMKMFRRAQEGVNPDLEIGRYLTEPGVPPQRRRCSGALEYQQGTEEPRTLGVLNGYVANEGDAWHYTLDALGLFYEAEVRQLARRAPGRPLVGVGARPGGIGAAPTRRPTPSGPILDSAELLGRRTAELHVALAGGTATRSGPSRSPRSTSARSTSRCARRSARRCGLRAPDRAARYDGEARERRGGGAGGRGAAAGRVRRGAAATASTRPASGSTATTTSARCSTPAATS